MKIYEAKYKPSSFSVITGFDKMHFMVMFPRLNDSAMYLQKYRTMFSMQCVVFDKEIGFMDESADDDLDVF